MPEEDSVFSNQPIPKCGMKLIEVDEGTFEKGTSGISLHLFDASSNHKKSLVPYLLTLVKKSNRKL
jgi:hypothetical protein